MSIRAGLYLDVDGDHVYTHTDNTFFWASIYGDFIGFVDQPKYSIEDSYESLALVKLCVPAELL